MTHCQVEGCPNNPETILKIGMEQKTIRIKLCHGCTLELDGTEVFQIGTEKLVEP